MDFDFWDFGLKLLTLTILFLVLRAFNSLKKETEELSFQVFISSIIWDRLNEHRYKRLVSKGIQYFGEGAAEKAEDEQFLQGLDQDLRNIQEELHRKFPQLTREEVVIHIQNSLPARYYEQIFPQPEATKEKGGKG